IPSTTTPKKCSKTTIRTGSTKRPSATPSAASLPTATLDQSRPSPDGYTDVAAAYDRGREEAEQAVPFYARYDFWVAAFTALLFVATLLLWSVTRRLVLDAKKSADNALAHAKESAAASLVQAEKSSQAGLRAYISVVSVKVTDIVPGKVPNAHFTIENSGNT